MLMAVVTALYAALRLIAWYNTVLLEDTDSMFYLGSIDAYYSMDWTAINRLNSDSTPFLPALGALANLLTGSTEVSARLISFVFSLILVAAVGLTARELDGYMAAMLAILILALNGPMISLSIAVLSEPSYIGTIYLGFYLLWKQLESPALSWQSAAGLGLLFGIAFLNRTEGILYVAAVPIAVFVLGWLMRDRQERPTAGRLVGWNAIYIMAFLVLAVPQILHVSTKMGSSAINGRIAWQTLVSGMPDHSVNAAIFGLDFVEDQTNISYIRSNYQDAVQRLGTTGGNGINVADRIKRSLQNSDKIYRKFVTDQITPFGFTLALVGLVALYLKGAFRGLLYCLFLFAVLMAGPVAHTSVSSRHIAPVIPLLCIFQGIGLRQTAVLLTRRVGTFSLSLGAVWIMLISILLAGYLFPLKNALNPPQMNKEYDPSFLVEPVRFVQNMEKVSSISAQRGYLAYLSGSAFFYAPFTQYKKLVRYLDANSVDLFYVDFERMADYPYVNEFRTDGYRQDFERIWVGERDGRPPAALFKLNADPSYQLP